MKNLIIEGLRTTNGHVNLNNKPGPLKRTALLLFVCHAAVLAFGQAYDEPWRPAFHFTPPAKWMNDPNGLVYHKGNYHLFYQYHPDDIVWGPMHWGHAESTDLLHWKHLPIALYPDSLGWIFSGSAVVDKNNTAGFGKDAMVAIFTYHNDAIWKSGRKNAESQGIAFSLDEGRTWTKYKNNPVLNNSGEQDFRDPKVSWNKKRKLWIMVLAAGDRIKIYSSPNLKQWTLESDFFPEVKEPYGVWECPDLFPMKLGAEEKWVLLLSQNQNGPNGGSATRYIVGDFDGKKFTAITRPQWIDQGMDYYAAVTYDNVPDGKRILLGWMSNWLYADKTPTKIWRSAMALPRELTLRRSSTGYSLFQALPATVQELTSPVFESANYPPPLEKNNLALDQAIVEFSTGGDPLRMTIRLTNPAGEEAVIRYGKPVLALSREKAGQIDFSPDFPKEQLLQMDERDALLQIKLIIDRSSIEILVNGGKYAMTAQLFPTQSWSTLTIDTPKALSDLKNVSIRHVTSTLIK